MNFPPKLHILNMASSWKKLSLMFCEPQPAAKHTSLLHKTQHVEMSLKQHD